MTWGGGRTLDRDLDLARSVPTLRARNLTRTLDRDLSFNPGLGLARHLVGGRDLDRARNSACDLVGYLKGLDAGTPNFRAGERHAEVRVAPVAGRLVAAAARMLPARVRARYAEEFRAELWEIARADQGRWPQLGYAARQVMAAPRLHAGLRIPRRRGAVPLSGR